MTAQEKLENARFLKHCALRADNKAIYDAEIAEALRLEGEALREIQIENQARSDNDAK